MKVGFGKEVGYGRGGLVEEREYIGSKKGFDGVNKGFEDL